MQGKQSREADDFIRKNHTKLSDREMAKKLGLSHEALKRRRQRLGILHDAALNPDDSIRNYTERQRNRTASRELQGVLAKHEALQHEFDALLALKASPPDTHAIRPKHAKNSTSGEATIVALLSDVHLEEEVRPENTNGLGNYSLAIAEHRVTQYFRTLLRLIQIEQKATQIDNLVLFLGGDFISGDIHEELLETCKLQPMMAINTARNWIASGLQYLLDNSDLKITLVCHSGNHARTTKKVRPSTEPGHSVEWLMYTTLADFFADDKRLTWIIPQGYLSYLPIYGTTVAFHHGHNVKYQGGVGGITISMNKAIAQWNRAQRADIYCCGHFHQVFDGGNFVVNGSMIGYNAFAIAIKAAYEKPAQVMFAVHSKRGKYMTRQIYFDEGTGHGGTATKRPCARRSARARNRLVGSP